MRWDFEVVQAKDVKGHEVPGTKDLIVNGRYLDSGNPPQVILEVARVEVRANRNGVFYDRGILATIVNADLRGPFEIMLKQYVNEVLRT